MKTQRQTIAIQIPGHPKPRILCQGKTDLSMEDLVPRLRLLALEEDLQLYQFDPERKNYFCVWDSSKEEKPAPGTTTFS